MATAAATAAAPAAAAAPEPPPQAQAPEGSRFAPLLRIEENPNSKEGTERATPLQQLGGIYHEKDQELSFISMSPKDVNGKALRVFKSLLDSGAAGNVVPTKCIPPRMIRRGKMYGSNYVSATGGTVKNEGEVEIQLCTKENSAKKMTYQVARIAKPLTSVARITEAGNRVVFDEYGGYIENKTTGETSAFKRVGRVYQLEVYARACPF